jgi:Subtilase family
MRGPFARSCRVSLAAITATATSFAFVTDTLAQGMMRGGGVGIMRSPTSMNPGRMPGASGGTISRIPSTGPGPRGPGFNPRIPGGPGIIVAIPPGGGGGPPPRRIVIDDDDDGPPKRRPPKIAKQQPSSPQRSGFIAPPSGERRLVPNEVLVTTSNDLSPQAFDAILQRHRLTHVETQDFALTGRRVHRLRINGSRSVGAVIAALRAEGQLSRAGANYQYALLQATGAAAPGAALAAAGEVPSDQYALSKLRLPEAHAIARGDRVLVAVIDSMIDRDHPDLKGVVADTFNATGAEDKPHPHGTGMAGAIASQGRITGAAPAVRVLAVKAFGASGKGGEGTTFHILKSVDWSVKAGARILNMSFAGPADPELRDMLAAAHKKQVVLIAAAGNAGPKSPPLFPAADPNVIAVTATDAQDRGFARAVQGKHIAVAAPGVDILVPAPDANYQLTSGTSVAAAEISGVAALLVERGPKLDTEGVRKLLTATARDLGPKGHDPQFGAGLTDAYQALMTMTPPPVAAPRTATQ